ncbi:hypothetical protein [Sphingomonas sp. S2-65]|uniref:hypothetical protein n=1 Tax=Sphingomonas sp. S2-65 TaxID=2903960 RepID=UPI001F1B079E|nr:hypothetical protein [Sphingomonas sp. S2-65]UYY57148.1 hypothetical protein LZ586_10665 [Sphingomonas sp. S2-65]
MHADEIRSEAVDRCRASAPALRQMRGAERRIDPLTISQTTCRGGSDKLRLSVPSAGEPAGMFDLIVDHPEPRFEQHRPKWRAWSGDQAVSILKVLRPAAGWRVIEARPVSEPIVFVPMERVAIRLGEDVALMLPPGRYKPRIIDVVAPKETS